jgi:hypothetical protein
LDVDAISMATGTADEMLENPGAHGFEYDFTSLERQNEVLLLKHLHKFYNKDDLPWVNLIWANYYKNESTPGQIRRGAFW